MQPFASYDITLTGTAEEILEALFCITDVIGDQDNILPSLLDKYDPDEADYYDDEDNKDNEDEEKEDFDDNLASPIVEETIEIWQTEDCVWIEDIEKLAAEIAINAPSIKFSISGHIEDPSNEAGDEMDFKIAYSNKKLFSQKTDWYQYIHMDDFEDYYDFGDRFTGPDGKPRYSLEDYEGFCQCADEWYVLGGGHGEFSTNAPLQDPVRIKLKFPKY